MRSRTAVILIVLTIALAQASSLASTTYRYAAVCGSDLCLVAANAETLRVLAKGGGGAWDGPAVSPKSGTIVALLYPDAGYFAAKLYRVDPLTGKKHSILGGKGFHVPECPVWLDDNALLLGKVGKEGLDEGVYTFNVRTGASKRVVPPMPDNEFFYDPLALSPSRCLLLTSLGITGGFWLSVNDIARGKSLWRTNPNEGMGAFTGVAWSMDSRTLFVSFCVENDPFGDGPGGVWRFDARTGKQYPWKYAKRSIDGICSVPKQQILVVERGDSIDLLRMTDGKLLRTLSGSEMGGVLGAFALGGNHWILCGTRLIAEMDSSGKRFKAQRVRGLSSSTVRFSPARNAIMFGGASQDGVSDDKAGVLDLRTGRVTRFAANDWRVEWLPRDIVR